jgi:hypothetical protein
MAAEAPRQGSWGFRPRSTEERQGGRLLRKPPTAQLEALQPPGGPRVSNSSAPQTPKKNIGLRGIQHSSGWARSPPVRTGRASGFARRLRPFVRMCCWDAGQRRQVGLAGENMRLRLPAPADVRSVRSLRLKAQRRSRDFRTGDAPCQWPQQQEFPILRQRRVSSCLPFARGFA